MQINYNCDFQDENCTGEDSEIRILPLDDMSNIHVCKNHYFKEKEYRRSRNISEGRIDIFWENPTTLRQIPHNDAFDTNFTWEDLKVYKPE
jgi:hypothetical protein